MKIKLEPRPTGEAARVVFREYDVPLDPDAGLPSNFVQNDGSDWSLGTPVGADPGLGRARRLARSQAECLVHLQHSEQADHDRPDHDQDRRGQAVHGAGARKASWRRPTA